MLKKIQKNTKDMVEILEEAQFTLQDLKNANDPVDSLYVLTQLLLQSAKETINDIDSTKEKDAQKQLTSAMYDNFKIKTYIDFLISEIKKFATNSNLELEDCKQNLQLLSHDSEVQNADLYETLDKELKKSPPDEMLTINLTKHHLESDAQHKNKLIETIKNQMKNQLAAIKQVKKSPAVKSPATTAPKAVLFAKDLPFKSSLSNKPLEAVTEEVKKKSKRKHKR